MKKAFKRVLIFTGVVLGAGLMVVLLVRLTPEPPLEEMDYARECLSNAVRTGADKYSSRLYREAKAGYDSAMANWKRENERFIFLRDYDKVLSYANLAAEKATMASVSSRNNTSTLRSRITEKKTRLTEIAGELGRLFNSYPLDTEVRKKISKGRMLLEEAGIAFEKGHYLEANRKILESEQLLTEAYENASENLKEYFSSYPQWRKWVEKTISESKKTGGYSIIIDKFSRKLTVYQKGVRKMEFQAELGKNWVGDKKVKGDHATPEGMYKVTKKLDSRKTKYYKALLLDYPNAEDMERFRKDVANGKLPSTAKIGGLIEIHGNGGKGIDWTEGCVALTDREMDDVFRIAAPGTPVTIVGSTVELKHILNEK